MAKVSVIVPVYNVEPFLARCLDSLLNQTLQDIEIICVNDGSTDNSPAILEEYAKKDKRIVHINQRNQGMSVARNIALATAKGEFIGYVDSDDYISLDFYEKLYNAAKKHDADIACASITRQRKHTAKHRFKYSKEEVFDDISEKLKAAYIPEFSYVWNKIYNREKLEKTGIKFIPNRYFEDIPYSLKVVSELGRLVTVPGPEYYYWVNMNSVVKNQCNKKIEDLKISKEETRKYALEHNIKLNKRAMITGKTKVALFGINILKIYHWENEDLYCLFGILPFIKVKRGG